MPQDQLLQRGAQGKAHAIAANQHREPLRRDLERVLALFDALRARRERAARVRVEERAHVVADAHRFI